MTKAMSVKKPGSRRIEQYHEDKALEKALGLSLS